MYYLFVLSILLDLKLTMNQSAIPMKTLLHSKIVHNGSLRIAT